MTLNPVLLLGLAAAGLAFASSKSSGSGSVVTAKPGETWKVTAKAVGMKMDSTTEAAYRAGMANTATISVFTLNDAGDTVTVTLTYLVETHIILNTLIQLAPGVGLIITDATRLKAS